MALFSWLTNTAAFLNTNVFRSEVTLPFHAVRVVNIAGCVHSCFCISYLSFSCNIRGSTVVITFTENSSKVHYSVSWTTSLFILKNSFNIMKASLRRLVPSGVGLHVLPKLCTISSHDFRRRRDVISNREVLNESRYGDGLSCLVYRCSRRWVFIMKYSGLWQRVVW
jgi:hypothetical protein